MKPSHGVYPSSTRSLPVDCRSVELTFPSAMSRCCADPASVAISEGLDTGEVEHRRRLRPCTPAEGPPLDRSHDRLQSSEWAPASPADRGPLMIVVVGGSFVHRLGQRGPCLVIKTMVVQPPAGRCRGQAQAGDRGLERQVKERRSSTTCAAHARRRHTIFVN